MMKLLLLTTCVTACVLCALAEDEGPEFTMETTFMPKDGCERKSAAGDKLTVHYVGKLESGKEFDSSRGRDAPFAFNLGMGEVIKGWELGMRDMCVGEKRKLVVPPKYGYGDEEAGPIPPGSTLFFDVELLSMEPGNDPETIFNSMDSNSDGFLDKKEVRRYLIKMGAMLDEVGMMMEDEETGNSLLDKMMRIHDWDENGLLTLEEFAKPQGRARERERDDKMYRERERERVERAAKEEEEAEQNQTEDQDDVDDDEGIIEDDRAQTEHSEL